MKRSFIDELNWRGMIHDMTPGLAEKLASGAPVTGYIGFDPTAASLTLGNYVQIMLLKFFQLSGHKPIVLLGGATGRIGDPSGKDTERELKTYDELDQNLAHQVEQVHQLLDFSDNENGAVLVNNLDFYRHMNVLEFLRDVGKNLTINYMMSKESVKRRVETGMSYTEFSYQLLQAYDFLCLFREHNCVFQMGGSDQWGNITSGMEFIRRNEPGSEVFALTSPLLTKADGKKFGKSEEGNIWLDPNLTSSYKFYQFWLNVDDRDLPKLFRYFSLRNKEEIEELESQHQNDPNALKAALGKEITIRIHGEQEFEAAKNVSEIMFNPRASKELLFNLTKADLRLIADELPCYKIDTNILLNKPTIIDLLAEHTTVLPSKSEARRAIQSNSISINKDKITDISALAEMAILLHDHYMIVEKGKKDKFMIEFV